MKTINDLDKEIENAKSELSRLQKERNNLLIAEWIDKHKINIGDDVILTRGVKSEKACVKDFTVSYFKDVHPVMVLYKSNGELGLRIVDRLYFSDKIVKC